MRLTLTLKDLPDIDFVNTDVNKILNDMIAGYEQAYYESTGVRKKLYPGDPIRIWLYTQALREFQLRVLIDDAAKQNLLKYARKENLKHLGAFSRTSIFEPVPAKAKVKFTLSQARPTDEIIPHGTRVSPGNEIYFEVDQDVKVPAGIQEVIVDVTCTEAGTIGNGFTPGQINILVDPLPYNASVENIDTSQGGADEEDADSYRERIHLAPEGFSVAGPEGAYEYFARQYSPLVSDVKITNPSDGVVDIRVLLQNGELPDTTFLEGIYNYLSSKERRPLTDKVQVSEPTTVEYNIDLTYYISNADVAQEVLIKSRVEDAIQEYVIWQKSRIGRDINPSELISRIIQAGAKRVEVNAPKFTPIQETEVAIAGNLTITYGGLEDE